MTQHRRIPRNIPRDRGVALIAVTALALVIAVLALGLSRESRLGVQVATSVRAQTEAMEAAKAIELWTGLRLAAEQAGAPRALSQTGPVALFATSSLPVDGRITRGRAFAFDAETRVQAERGKVDLLTASPDLVRDLLIAANVPGAETIADHVARIRGAGASGISWRLDARPINSLDELAQVLGLSREVLARLQQVATVHGGLGEPDPVTAPRDLYEVLELDEDTRRLTRLARAETRAIVAPREPQTYTISTKVTRADGVTLFRARMLTITADGKLTWHAALE